jgi:hypothetical protein
MTNDLDAPPKPRAAGAKSFPFPFPRLQPARHLERRRDRHPGQFAVEAMRLPDLARRHREVVEPQRHGSSASWPMFGSQTDTEYVASFSMK